MICAYSLSVEDDGSYMLGEETGPAELHPGFHDWRFLKNGVPHPATCQVCDRKTDLEFVNPRFRVSRRKWDAVVTGDGYYLVSSAFRDVARRYGWTDVGFAELPGDPDYFWLRPSRIVAFDSDRRETRFEHRCPACKGWFDVVGAHPIMCAASIDHWRLVSSIGPRVRVRTRAVPVDRCRVGNSRPDQGSSPSARGSGADIEYAVSQLRAAQPRVAADGRLRGAAERVIVRRTDGAHGE